LDPIRLRHIRKHRRDSKKEEDTTGEKEKRRKAEKDRVKEREKDRIRGKRRKQIAALGVEMVGSWFVR